MDCGCQKTSESNWPDKEDETGEMIFHQKDKNDLIDRIRNRREYDYSSSSEDEDDFFLEQLAKKITPKKETINDNMVRDDTVSNDGDHFLSELRANTYKLTQEDKENRDKIFDSSKEEQIRTKLYKLK